MPATKVISFLYDQISGTFLANRSHGRDRQAIEMTAKIEKAVGYQEPFLQIFAESVVYTTDLTFKWLPEAPESLTSIEAFWKMYKQGKNIGDCFKFYSDNVDNLVMVGLNERYRLERMTPDDLRTLGETQAEIVVSNEILYKNVPIGSGTKGWHEAMIDALKSWQPSNPWKLLSELPETDRNDPKSSPNTGESASS